MAFVYQAERNLEHKINDMPPTVGPGTYVGHAQYKAKPYAAPFNSQVTRGKPLKKDSAPGPGSYDVELQFEGQKVVLQSASSEVKIMELPKHSSVFQSATKRFNDKKLLNTPGPGSYETEVKIKPIQQQYTSQQYIEELMRMNRYQSIPSIPANHQTYGYTEKGNQQLELNKSPLQEFAGVKCDKVGPGQYTLKDTFEINKNKGPSWHKSKVPKLAASVGRDREQQVGPGAYDHESTIIPLYKLNPSGAFLSKSQRMFDMQRGQKAREFMKVQFETQKRKLMQNPAFQDIDDEEIEFIEDATPGPGHYYPNNTTLSTASQYSQSMTKLGNSKAAFGAKSKRFKEKEQPIQIGPGDYEVTNNIVKPAIPLTFPPFLSSNTRFETKLLEMRPGPQSYNPKVTLEDHLIKKLERAPVGKFGSNQPRFQDNENEVPGPGAYDEKQGEKDVAISVFKSQTKRVGVQGGTKDQYPAPGAYEVKNYTIEQSTKIEKEEDPDLAVKKPPFGSSLPRFKEKEQKAIDEEDEDYPEQIQHNSSDLFKKQKKDHPAFNTQEKRFQNGLTNNKNLVPGPGEYHDPKASGWDKKTFNILFSEI